MEYLTFHVGEREFGVDLGRVREIVNPLPITRVPGMPSALLGLVGLRGDPAPVIDAGLRLAGRAVERSARTPLLILTLRVQDQPAEVALLVEAAGRKLTVDSLLPWSERLARFAGADACAGFADVDGRMVIVLDVDRLLAFERVAVAGHVDRACLAAGHAPTPALEPSPGRAAANPTAPTGASFAPSVPVSHAAPPAERRPRLQPQAPPRVAVTPTRALVTPTRAAVPRMAPVRSSIPVAEARIPRRFDPADAAEPLPSPTALRGGRSLGWLVAGAAAGLAVAVFLLAPGSGRRRDESPRSAPRTGAAAASPVRAAAALPPAGPPAVFAPPAPSAASSAPPQAVRTAPSPLAMAAVDPPREARPPRQLPPSMVVTPETPACEIHDVKRGESLWAIARRKLGDPYRWKQLFGENRDRIVDPDVIEIDDRIRIPGACQHVEK